MSSDHFESGGEDWPDAYRHSPISREESLGCVVIWWHHEWQTTSFPALQLPALRAPLGSHEFQPLLEVCGSTGTPSPCMLGIYVL